MTASLLDIEAVIRLGGLVLALGREDRATFHQDGTTPESVTDHTVMLSVLACAIAAEHLPELDLGLVSQLATVHDFVEVYARDTQTLRNSPAEQADKVAREAAALARLRCEFAISFPWLLDTIDLYEARTIPEARFVKALDKLLPKIAHLLNEGATMRALGATVTDVASRYEHQLDELLEYASDFPVLFAMRAELVGRLLAVLHGRAPARAPVPAAIAADAERVSGDAP